MFICRLFHLSIKNELNSDVFEKMSDRQMTDFKEKAEKLQSDLNGVENETDEHEKYKKGYNQLRRLTFRKQIP